MSALKRGRKPLPEGDESTTSEHFCTQLIHLENRLRDLRDWLQRHEPPGTSWVRNFVDRNTNEKSQTVELWCEFPDYHSAHLWAFKHTRCLSDDRGFNAIGWPQYNEGCKNAFAHVRMPDFLIVLLYPMRTHPEAVLREVLA